MKNLPHVQRKKVASSPHGWVEVRPMFPDRRIPTVVEPKVEGLGLANWTDGNAAFVERLLEQHDALLFRNFRNDGQAGFEGFVDACSSGERLAYTDRSTPRNTYGDRIYDATVYPADQRINLHNEGTYWLTWARKIFFCCITNAQTGGETPIGDVQAVYERIDPAIRREFEQRGVLYVRNYNHGFGLTWQNVFQTEERAEVEAYCRENRIDYEWKGGDRLRTRQRRPAVRRHPRTGAPLWFNHAAFFHVSALEPAMQAMLLEQLGEDDLPYNTYYGDGVPIDPTAVRHILDAYEAEKVVFRWQEGDVAVYDNMRIAHAREPYSGERLTLVALTEPYSGPEA